VVGQESTSVEGQMVDEGRSENSHHRGETQNGDGSPQSSSHGDEESHRGGGVSSESQDREENRPAENGQEVKKPSADEVAAEEHHIIQEIEELARITRFPGEVTKNPITQQQEIIREMKGLAEPKQGKKTGEERTDGQFEKSESEEHRTEEVVETHPAVKSEHGSLGVHHGSVSGHQVVHNGEISDHKKSTPDPLDLMSIYNDYLKGDFKPGQLKEPLREPKKELKPEIKQAIDNIMRDWEVLPDTEGKPIPPPRNFKATKHVKVTTHNHPVVLQPSQTITKTVKTHTYHPSHHVIHHINIAELLEQLRQLESSPHHRNVTWCEEKIKEFLTELNRKEESGIEINQSVQEETLHHILTQDQTITKEVHHVIGHVADGGVEEEPFVKKTVVELGLNEPTKSPSYCEEGKARQETHHSTEDNSEQKEVGAVEGEPRELEYGVSEETHIVHVTPGSGHVPPLESLSHQTHTSTKENVPGENVGDMEPHGSEHQEVTSEPHQPTQGSSGVEEFQGEVEKHDRPLPPNYKPRERSEEETNESETTGVKEEHKGIDNLTIDLPENEFSREEGNEEHQGHDHSETNEVLKEEEDGHHQEEHVVHEVNTGENSGGEETAHPPSEGGHGGVIQTEYTEETEEHHKSGGSHGQVGKGSRTENTEETVEHHNPGGSHSGGGSQTVYTEETVERHNSGGSYAHSGGGSQTEYTEETVEHHNSGGSRQINYDQLIEELISLESLPGHQAIDKCEEKIRQFLEVLKNQQERGFDQNKAELERLRHLIEEMQAQRQNQIKNGQTPEPSTSFWKKIGRKIKSTFEKAKTKAHETVNDMMN